jgi:uncharacterized oxidoreductase
MVRRVPHLKLQDLVTKIFVGAGCSEQEASEVSEHLVDSNLVGHDSHGVIRVATYVNWLEKKMVFANREPKVVLDEGALAILDGRLGLGQVIAARATDLAIEKATKHGIGVVGLRNSGHIGRVGAWAHRVARAGKVAVCFVNTTGFGLLTAPHGGTDRRISANPFAVGVPNPGGVDFIFDISTSTIAEGKIRVAFHRGEKVPDGCILDGEGKPTNDPEKFYADPGSILPFGGHKGYGMALAVDILAGALIGASCSRPGVPQLEQGMLIIVVDPERAQSREVFAEEVARFLEFVKASPKASPDTEILAPGDIEERNRSQRIADGIELDDKTWAELLATCESVGIDKDAAMRTIESQAPAP